MHGEISGMIHHAVDFEVASGVVVESRKCWWKKFSLFFNYFSVIDFNEILFFCYMNNFKSLK